MSEEKRHNSVSVPGVEESRFEDKGALVRPHYFRADRIHVILSLYRVLKLKITTEKTPRGASRRVKLSGG